MVKQTVVTSVVYPAVEKYLDKYLESLEKQTTNDFVLLLANDGIPRLEELLARRKLEFYCFDVNSTIAGNRKLLIDQLLSQGYSKIIFADPDDTFASNRVELIGKMLEKDGIIVNDLSLMDQAGNEKSSGYFSARFSEADMITCDTLLNGNLMGLSNTAVSADLLEDIKFLEDHEPLAFDWYLWSLLLLKGNKARFTSQTLTHYRIHDNNIAGLPQPLNRQNVYTGVNVKSEHYTMLSGVNKTYSELASQYQTLADSFQDMDKNQQYIKALNHHAIDKAMWWENIRTPEEVGL